MEMEVDFVLYLGKQKRAKKNMRTELNSSFTLAAFEMQ